MSTTDLRKEILQFIETADDVFLKNVYAMCKSYPGEEIGYDSNGLPLTKENLKIRVKAASRRVKSGDFISHETIEEEIEG